MFICENCDKKFDKTPKGKTEWLNHRATHDPGLGKVPESATGKEIKKSMSAQEIKQQQAKENEGRKPKKPKITYQWEGECPTCFGILDSIVIEVGQEKGKVVAVAFCTSCKKEVSQRQVAKL